MYDRDATRCIIIIAECVYFSDEGTLTTLPLLPSESEGGNSAAVVVPVLLVVLLLLLTVTLVLGYAVW